MAQPCVILSEKDGIFEIVIRRSVGKALVKAGQSRLDRPTTEELKNEITLLLTAAREKHGRVGK